MNRLKFAKAYLPGPMDYAKDRGIGWRERITPFLRSLGIGVLSPTDKASFVGHEDVDHIEERKSIIEGIKSGNVLADTLYDRYHEIMKEVASIDLRMVDTSDFSIMYINTEIYTCGTFHENEMSILQRKPVIVMCEQGKVNTPPWLFAHIPHRMIFGSWIEVENYIKHIATSEKIDTLNRWRFFNYDKVFGITSNP